MALLVIAKPFIPFYMPHESPLFGRVSQIEDARVEVANIEF
jgi:hypothetical protein